MQARRALSDLAPQLLMTPMPRRDLLSPTPGAPKPQPASAAPASALRLAFTGDVCLGSAVFGPGAQDAEQLLARLPAMFAGSDLVVGNLEFAVAPHAQWRAARVGAIAVASSRLRGLGRSGFHVFSLANNHVMDAGPEGLRATRRLLAEEGLHALGAGETRAEAERPLVFQIRGRRIGLIATCDWSLHYAGSTRPGIAPLEPRALLMRTSALARTCDLVIVLLHADLEFTPHPAPWRQRLARALADAGAHAVIQHHPHVMQGWERRGGCVIAYSLGNFVFRVRGNAYQGHRPGTLDGLLLHLDADLRGPTPQLTPRFVPVRIGADHLPARPDSATRAAMLERLEQLSAELREPGRVRAAWRKRTAAEMRVLLYGIYADAMRGRLRSALATPWRVLMHPEDRRWLWGCMTAGWR
jgi:poly-gamma-glutamate synthesis protein (capsule biosynthesis protein)